MILTDKIRALSDALLTLAYPQACVICQQSVECRELGVACQDCWATTHLISADETLCWKCGVPSFGKVELCKRPQVRCGRCDQFTFTVARACGLYEKALRETVLSLKQQPRVPKRVVELLASVASQNPLKSSTSIIPVPLHPERYKARGFNQASIIARSLSRQLRLPLNEVSLIRTSHTPRYRAGLDAKGRSDTVAKAFETIHPGLIRAERILLVDDVLTTGATAASCSTVLIEAGAEMVSVLTIARTP
jgi:ComF family protein